MAPATARLRSAEQILLDGIDAGLHIGAQLHVRVDGEVVADVAVGLARDGVPMTVDTSMIWFSTTKAVTAVAAAVVWERGGFDLDDRVATHLPEFGAGGKDGITVRHVLTHTGGFRFAGNGGGQVLRDLDESWADVCAAPLERGWMPGQKAGYHPTSGMAVLARLVEQADGRAFRRFVREEIFEPLDMPDCWIGMPAERYEADAGRIGVMHNTEHEPRPLPAIDTVVGATACIPGGGGRGPMAQLARFYEMLRGKGELDGARILTPPTVDALTARHRAGMRDETFGVVIDWGLGFIVDSIIFGHYASTRSFGHGGARSSVAFCDPETDLVAAFVCNGMPAQAAHYARMASVCDALYEDLGLAEAGRWRDRPVPGGGLL